MTSPTPLDSRIREAERSLFEHYKTPVTEHQVELADPKLHIRVLEFGPPEARGIPILLLHGIASVTAAAAPLIGHLAEKRRILAIDWPGHGLSGPITLPRGVSLRTHAASVIDAVLEAFHVDRIDLAGHSMGGQFSLYYALHAPSRIRRLVLLGAPGAGMAGVKPIPAMRAAAVPGLGAALLKAPMPQFAQDRSNDQMIGKGVLKRFPPEMAEIGYLVGRRPGFAPSVSSFFRALITPLRIRAGVPASLAELRTLQTPTLLVWGDQDVFLTPDRAAESIDALAQHELVRITGGGHLPWLNEPERCNQAVSEFLGED